MGVAVGNFALRVLSSRGGNDSEERNTPRPAAFRRCVLVVALTSSVAMAVGGPPAALASVSRQVVLGALAVVCVVAGAGALWGCTRGGAAGNGGARGVYATVASDDRDVEVELKPFVAADNGPDSRGEDDDYLDEEDGYLADEGEEVGEQGANGSGRVREQWRRGGDRRPSAAAAAAVPSPRAKLSPPSRADGGGLGGTGAGVTAREEGEKGEKKAKLAAPPAQSLFPAGHTMEL